MLIQVTRLVPRGSLERSDVVRLAERLDWIPKSVADRGDLYERTWQTPDRAAVHWIEDGRIKVSYFAVAGPGFQRAIDALRREVDLHDDASISALIVGVVETNDDDALMSALFRLGVHASGEFDKNLFELFKKGLSHPNPLVRRFALLAAAMTAWDQFAPLVESIRDSDLSESVREQAALVFDANRSRWGVAQ